MSLRTSVSLLALLLISNQTYAASPRIVGGQPSSVGHWPYLMHIVDDSVSSADYQHIFDILPHLRALRLRRGIPITG